MKLKLQTFMLAILSVLTLSSKPVSANDSISIVSDSTYAPFEFKDTDQIYKGIDVDIITEVAKINNWNYKMTFPGFDAAVNAVQAGQADALMAGTTVTEARQKVFHFSDTYYDTKIVIITTKKNQISDYAQLKGKTVGVKNGTTSQAFLEKNKDKYGYTIKVYDTGDLMYNSLATGAVNAVMDDMAVAQYAINQGQDLNIAMEGENNGSFAFAVKKDSGHDQLIEDFNRALKEMKADGRLDAILDKWLGQAPTQASDKTVDESSILGLLSNNYKQLLSGLGTTLSLAILSFALAMIIGLVFGMMRVSPHSAPRLMASIFVDVVRGIPLMIVAAFIFWGLPNLLESLTGKQSPINEFVAGTIALSLNGGAYIAEIVRGGIEAVPAGQMEASRSLGISYPTTMRKVILPQAVKLMLPNFINQFVISLKDTTIISAIGMVELFQTGKIIIARNYQSFRMYAILAVLYLIMITALTRLAKGLEKRTKNG